MPSQYSFALATLLLSSTLCFSGTGANPQDPDEGSSAFRVTRSAPAPSSEENVTDSIQNAASNSSATASHKKKQRGDLTVDAQEEDGRRARAAIRAFQRSQSRTDNKTRIRARNAGNNADSATVSSHLSSAEVPTSADNQSTPAVTTAGAEATVTPSDTSGGTTSAQTTPSGQSSTSETPSSATPAVTTAGAESTVTPSDTSGGTTSAQTTPNAQSTSETPSSATASAPLSDPQNNPDVTAANNEEPTPTPKEVSVTTEPDAYPTCNVNEKNEGTNNIEDGHSRGTIYEQLFDTAPEEILARLAEEVVRVISSNGDLLNEEPNPLWQQITENVPTDRLEKIDEALEVKILSMMHSAERLSQALAHFFVVQETEEVLPERIAYNILKEREGDEQATHYHQDFLHQKASEDMAFMRFSETIPETLAKLINKLLKRPQHTLELAYEPLEHLDVVSPFLKISLYQGPEQTMGEEEQKRVSKMMTVMESFARNESRQTIDKTQRFKSVAENVATFIESFDVICRMLEVLPEENEKPEFVTKWQEIKTDEERLAVALADAMVGNDSKHTDRPNIQGAMSDFYDGLCSLLPCVWRAVLKPGIASSLIPQKPAYPMSAEHIQEILNS